MVFKTTKSRGDNAASLKRSIERTERLQKLKVPSTMGGRVDICVYKVTAQAGNTWRRFKGVSAALWQASFVTFYVVLSVNM
jgi:hypothetical protein